MKCLGSLYHESYCQRLAILELDSLRLWRIKTDLLLCYKVISSGNIGGDDDEDDINDDDIDIMC